MSDAPVSASPERELFELSLDLLGVVDEATGRFTRVNRAWERTLGWPAEDLMTRPFMSFVHPDDVARTSEIAQELTRGRDHGVVGFENRWRHADGTYRFLLWSARAVDGVWYAAAKDITTLRLAEEGVRASERLHRTLTANLPDTTVFLVDAELRILVADGEAVRRLGWFDEQALRGRRVTDLYDEVPRDVLTTAVGHYRAALAGERRQFELASGGVTFAIDAVPVPDALGAVSAALVLARDVTVARRSAEQVTRRVEQQRALAELGRHALEARDIDHLLRDVARTATSALGVDRAVVLACDPGGDELTVVAGDGPGVAAELGRRIPLEPTAAAVAALRTGAPVIVSDWSDEPRHPAPPLVAAWEVGSSIIVALGRPDRRFGLLGVHADAADAFTEEDVDFAQSVAAMVSVAIERLHEEGAVRHAALHDPLTGLPNRTLVADRLSRALAHRRRDATGVAVLVLDLDRFKVVNDSLGHAEGDEILMQVAPRLLEAVREQDTVGRVGGDEFVVVCEEVTGPRDALEVAERVAEGIARPFVTRSGEHFFTASVGITLATAETDTPESLIRDADAAMYRAKDRGRGRLELFDDRMRADVVHRVETESALRRALERDELEAWYQPVVDLRNGAIVAVEALARWRRPDRGVVLPGEFIPVAEEAGLIGDLGMAILEAACRDAATWQRDVGGALGVAVNVSGRQVPDPQLPARIAAVARRHGVADGTLTLEITESVLMDDTDMPHATMAELRERGIRLALDDFGTGYSSLNRLRGAPIDVVKVDRSFVTGLGPGSQDEPIVRAIIDMAHALGLAVVAEGVETPEHLRALRALRCDFAQGFLFARPMSAAALARLLRERPAYDAGSAA